VTTSRYYDAFKRAMMTLKPTLRNIKSTEKTDPLHIIQCNCCNLKYLILLITTWVHRYFHSSEDEHRVHTVRTLICFTYTLPLRVIIYNKLESAPVKYMYTCIETIAIATW